MTNKDWTPENLLAWWRSYSDSCPNCGKEPNYTFLVDPNIYCHFTGLCKQKEASL